MEIKPIYDLYVQCNFVFLSAKQNISKTKVYHFPIATILHPFNSLPIPVHATRTLDSLLHKCCKSQYKRKHRKSERGRRTRKKKDIKKPWIYGIMYNIYVARSQHLGVETRSWLLSFNAVCTRCLDARGGRQGHIYGMTEKGKAIYPPSTRSPLRCLSRFPVLTHFPLHAGHVLRSQCQRKTCENIASFILTQESLRCLEIRNIFGTNKCPGSSFCHLLEWFVT